MDSEIVRAMIEKDSYGFNTFVATRVGEIQNSTNTSEWYWVKSGLNIADIITKGEIAQHLSSDSEWQKGPPFLSTPVKEWPIRNDYVSSDDLPEKAKQILLVDHSEPCIIDIERFSSYTRLVRTTARLQKLKSCYSFALLVEN